MQHTFFLLGILVKYGAKLTGGGWVFGTWVDFIQTVLALRVLAELRAPQARKMLEKQWVVKPFQKKTMLAFEF